MTPHGRAGAGRRRWAPFLVVVTAVALASPEAARAQSAATVAPTDPVYADLERLEAFGLVPRG
ncbi:MAG TPA: hypothetical protein VLA36_08290, partial [Longimicrobiales bacterium]|nr:hypothetical protein [Longimicrobiales bacterium]